MIAMAALTDILLLGSVSKLCGEKIPAVRCAFAALAGGAYVGLCLVAPIGHWLLRLISRAVLSTIAFGITKDLWRKSLLLISLTTALECAADGGGQRLLPMLLCVAAVVLLTLDTRQALLPVELCYNGTSVKLTALKDTGNTLRDPITGESVLVVGADVAQSLTGLSPQQLRSPLSTIGALPGLRLIPYKTVAGRGFLLAMPLKDARIGTYRGSSIVAFAPEGIGNGNYQALTGGIS